MTRWTNEGNRDELCTYRWKSHRIHESGLRRLRVTFERCLTVGVSLPMHLHHLSEVFVHVRSKGARCGCLIEFRSVSPTPHPHHTHTHTHTHTSCPSGGPSRPPWNCCHPGEPPTEMEDGPPAKEQRGLSLEQDDTDGNEQHGPRLEQDDTDGKGNTHLRQHGPDEERGPTTDPQCAPL
jgi:hypothetical protein